MPKWRNSFPVRASRRLYLNRGKACPDCGQTDPLLLGEDGRCANCSSHNTEENHHILYKGFRKSKEDRLIVLPVSPNAHRLLSDLQSGHPPPPVADPDSMSFRDAFWLELIVSMSELWLVLTYLNEQRDLREVLPIVIGILVVFLFLININQLDLSRMIQLAEKKLHEEKA